MDIQLDPVWFGIYPLTRNLLKFVCGNQPKLQLFMGNNILNYKVFIFYEFIVILLMTLNFSLMKIGLTKITFFNSIHMGQMKKTHGSNNDIILKLWRLKQN